MNAKRYAAEGLKAQISRLKTMLAEVCCSETLAVEHQLCRSLAELGRIEHHGEPIELTFNVEATGLVDAAEVAVLAEAAFEGYRTKLAELNAGKAMTGTPMPRWSEVVAKKPDEPGGHVAACWAAAVLALGKVASLGIRADAR